MSLNIQHICKGINETVVFRTPNQPEQYKTEHMTFIFIRLLNPSTTPHHLAPLKPQVLDCSL